MSIQIIPFEVQYAVNFYQLNIDWLEKYFYVEDYDKKVLQNPQSTIIDNGALPSESFLKIVKFRSYPL